MKKKTELKFLPSAFSTVSATPKQIFDALKNVTTLSVDPYTRSTLNSAFHKEYFLNYGCWCTFGEDGSGLMLGQKGGNQPYPGRGAPQNKWDETCRSLQWGYECAAIAAGERGEDCRPHLVDYVDFGGLFSSMEEYYHGSGGGFGPNAETMCRFINPGHSVDSCVINACMIEGAFVTRAKEMFGIQELHQVNDDSFDEQFLHSNGFDFDGECVGRPGVSGERVCCGEIPDITPYKTNDDLARDCCYDDVSRTPQIYSQISYECCPDNVVKVFGTCA